MIHFSTALVHDHRFHRRQGPAWTFYCFTSENENNSAVKNHRSLKSSKPSGRRTGEGGIITHTMINNSARKNKNMQLVEVWWNQRFKKMSVISHKKCVMWITQTYTIHVPIFLQLVLVLAAEQPWFTFHSSYVLWGDLTLIHSFISTRTHNSFSLIIKTEPTEPEILSFLIQTFFFCTKTLSLTN